MKDTELKKLLKDKDLSKEEDFNAVLTGINNEANSTISKRDETIEVLKKENDSLKATAKTFDSTKKELEAQSAEKDGVIDSLNKRLYISKNINNKLEAEDEEDLLTLTEKKMAQNKDAKFEDVVMTVAKKRMFNEQADKIIPPAPKAKTLPAGNPVIPEDKKVSRTDAMAWLGLNHTKK